MPPGVNFPDPHDTRHLVTLDGTDAAVETQVLDLARMGTVGTLTRSR